MPKLLLRFGSLFLAFCLVAESVPAAAPLPPIPSVTTVPVLFVQQALSQRLLTPRNVLEAIGTRIKIVRYSQPLGRWYLKTLAVIDQEARQAREDVTTPSIDLAQTWPALLAQAKTLLDNSPGEHRDEDIRSFRVVEAETAFLFVMNAARKAASRDLQDSSRHGRNEAVRQRTTDLARLWRQAAKRWPQGPVARYQKGSVFKNIALVYADREGTQLKRIESARKTDRRDGRVNGVRSFS